MERGPIGPPGHLAVQIVSSSVDAIATTRRPNMEDAIAREKI